MAGTILFFSSINRPLLFLWNKNLIAQDEKLLNELSVGPTNEIHHGFKWNHIIIFSLYWTRDLFLCDVYVILNHEDKDKFRELLNPLSWVPVIVHWLIYLSVEELVKDSWGNAIYNSSYSSRQNEISGQWLKQFCPETPLQLWTVVTADSWLVGMVHVLHLCMGVVHELLDDCYHCILCPGSADCRNILFFRSVVNCLGPPKLSSAL